MPSRRNALSWSRVWAGIKSVLLRVWGVVIGSAAGSVVVVGAAHVVVQRQRGLGWLGLERLAIHAALEDRVDGLEPRRADRLRPRARGLQPLGPVAARQALQAQTRSVALLGMRAMLHLPAHHRGTGRTDALA